MKINIPFRRKDSEIETSPCVVEKTVELPAEQFNHFSKNLLNDYDFILENIDQMYQDNNGVNHCLLVLCEERDDGIIVESEGSSYARYSAYLPCARKLIQQEQYPSLTAYADEMRWLADKYVQKALNGQLDCQYRIDFDEVRNLCRHNGFNEELFIDMLSDRDEIDDVDFLDDGCTVTISDPYLRQGNEENLRRLNSEEVEIICAKHILWLHDAGGEQADFSNCLIKDMNLSGKNLINAVFNGTKFVNTDLSKAEFCFALFNSTRFQNCNLSDVIAEESEFKYSEYVACAFDRAIFTHSNFTGAKFYDCTMKNGSLQNCCIDKTEFGDMNLGSVDMRNCGYDEQEWTVEQLGENISM